MPQRPPAHKRQRHPFVIIGQTSFYNAVQQSTAVEESRVETSALPPYRVARRCHGTSIHQTVGILHRRSITDTLSTSASAPSFILHRYLPDTSGHYLIGTSVEEEGGEGLDQRNKIDQLPTMIVTPPMTLPGRGWGDGGDRGRRRGRSRGVSSCYTFSLADVPAKHGVPAICGNSVEKNGSTRSIATRDTASISSSSSSSSIGSSNCCSGVGGDEERVGATATSSRRGKGRVRVAYFELSDGFSSAEEETWGSEGEIEESTAAGRHVIMHVHPGSGCAGRRHPGPSNVALARRGDSARLDAGSVGGNSCGKGKGGRGESTPPLPIDQLDDAQLRLIRAAPFCGSVVAGLRIGHDGSFAVVASAAAAAAAAASATRGAPVVGSRRVASREKSRGSPGGRRVSMTQGGVCDQGERSRKHTVRQARPLSIEIANKASEFPPKAGTGARGDGKPCGGRAGVDGQEKLTPGRSGGNVEEAGGAESYDEKNLLCGCAERCMRAAFYWCRSLALPMPIEIPFVLGGGARFSQLEEPSSSPFVEP